MNETIDLYGRMSCADTVRTRALLDELGESYDFHDTAADEDVRAEAAVVGGGDTRVPVVRFPNGTILVEPSDEAVLSVLGR